MSKQNDSDEKTLQDAQDKSARKGSGDPVQRAAREERLKKNLRENLRRRKVKARSDRSDSVGDA